MRIQVRWQFALGQQVRWAGWKKDPSRIWVVCWRRFHEGTASCFQQYGLGRLGHQDNNREHTYVAYAADLATVQEKGND